MPLMNGTGPLGNGPGSGRGYGMCAGSRRDFDPRTRPGLQGRGGMKMRRRMRGRSAMDRKTALEQEASWLERRLDWIRQQASGSAEQRK